MKYILFGIMMFSVLTSSLGQVSKNHKVDSAGAPKIDLTGVIKDAKTKDSIPFCNVKLVQNGKLVSGATSDYHGQFIIRGIKKGSYSIETNTVGYEACTLRFHTKNLRSGKISILLKAKIPSTKDVIITAYKMPLIGTCNGQIVTLSAEAITKMPTRNVADFSSTRSAPTSSDYGKGINIRGCRDGDNAVFINGCRVYGTNLPQPEKSGFFRRMFKGRKNKSENPPTESTPPLEESNERYAAPMENEFQKTRKEPLSTFSIDVDKTSYSNVRRFLNSGGLPPPDAVRIEELINYFPYQYEQPKNNHPFEIYTEQSVCPWNPEHLLVQIGLQGKIMEPEKKPASNLVFLIDVSGSMEEPNKLPLVKASLGMLTRQLTEEDKVSIVVYAGAAGLVLSPTSGKNKKEILDVIEKLESGGSTAGGEGIELAYKLAEKNFLKNGNNRILLATDGDFNVGVNSEEDLGKLIEEKRKTGIYLSVLGFGTGNFQDSKMEILADKGNGNYAYIDNMKEAQKVLVKELNGTLFTIAKDVKIQIEFNPNRVASYRLIGYENRLLEAEDFKNDKIDAGELGSGHTVTALYEIVPVASKNHPTGDTLEELEPLKYQKRLTIADTSQELMTINLRYKRPKEDQSNLLSHSLIFNPIAFDQASENLKFSSAVAQFGMILRSSKFKGNSSFKEVKKVASKGKGKDEEGYRAEFLQLVSLAESMQR